MSKFFFFFLLIENFQINFRRHSQPEIISDHFLKNIVWWRYWAKSMKPNRVWKMMENSLSTFSINKIMYRVSKFYYYYYYYILVQKYFIQVQKYFYNNKIFINPSKTECLMMCNTQNDPRQFKITCHSRTCLMNKTHETHCSCQLIE